MESKPRQKLDSFLFDQMGRTMYITHRLSVDIAPRVREMLNATLAKTYERPEFKFTNKVNGSIVSDGNRAIALMTIDYAYSGRFSMGLLLRGLGVKKLVNFEQLEMDGFLGKAKEEAKTFGFEYTDSGIIGKFSSFGLDFIDKASGFFIHIVPEGTNVERLAGLIRKEILKEKDIE